MKDELLRFWNIPQQTFRCLVLKLLLAIYRAVCDEPDKQLVDAVDSVTSNDPAAPLRDDPLRRGSN